MTGNGVALRNTGTELTLRDEQVGWDDKQVAALRQLGIKPDVGNADLAVFFHFAKRTGLDPFAKQIYMIGRWDNTLGRERQTIQTGIDGFRVIARRAADRSGIDYGMKPTEYCGEDGIWKDVWVAKVPPTACRETVIRNGMQFSAVALFTEYAATKRDGSLSGQWPTKPVVMIAKCAEALALRKAFPQDLSGIYTSEEMEQADNLVVYTPSTVTTDVSQPPATPATDAPAGDGPSPERLAADAGSLDELRGLYRDFKRDGLPAGHPAYTLLTQRGEEMAAAQALAEGLGAVPVDDEDVIEAEVVEETTAA